MPTNYYFSARVYMCCVAVLDDRKLAYVMSRTVAEKSCSISICFFEAVSLKYVKLPILCQKAYSVNWLSVS